MGSKSTVTGWGFGDRISNREIQQSDKGLGRFLVHDVYGFLGVVGIRGTWFQGVQSPHKQY